MFVLGGKREGEFGIDISLVDIEEEGIGMVQNTHILELHTSRFRRLYNLNILLFIFF